MDDCNSNNTVHGKILVNHTGIKLLVRKNLATVSAYAKYTFCASDSVNIGKEIFGK